MAKTHDFVASAKGYDKLIVFVDSLSRWIYLPFPLHAKLRQEDLHSKEFFRKLKQQKWSGNIKEIYKTSDWNNRVHADHDTTMSDDGIRREFRRYYSWLYSPKESQREPELEVTLSDRPLTILERRRMSNGRADHSGRDPSSHPEHTLRLVTTLIWA